MTDRYQRLRDAIAAGPTPGVRRISYDGMSVIDDTGGAILSRRPDGCSSLHVERGAQQAANVMLAAAADPGTIRTLLVERDALRDALFNLVDDITGLTEESEGVYGLHLNGDNSPWDELLPGGRYERLGSLDDALATYDEWKAFDKRADAIIDAAKGGGNAPE